jgi:cytidylate kinase
MVLDTVDLEDKVIVEGRSAFFLLKKEGVFRVLLVADENFRASRIAERRGISLEEAKEDIEHSDEERGNLVKRFYGLNWLDPKNYHLVINTSFKKMEDVAETILAAYNILFK